MADIGAYNEKKIYSVDDVKEIVEYANLRGQNYNHEAKNDKYWMFRYLPTF